MKEMCASFASAVLLTLMSVPFFALGVDEIKDEFSISAFASRESSIYMINEEVTFLVSLNDREGKPCPGKTLEFVLTGDGGLERKGTVITEEKPVEIKTSLSRPGFILLEVRLNKFPDAGKRPTVLAKMNAGAAVEPLSIKPGTPCPEDFDIFWNNELKELRARKTSIKETAVPEEHIPEEFKGKVKAYDIRIEDGILNLSGVLTMPAESKSGSLPIIIMFGGASWMGAPLCANVALEYNALCFFMNKHDTQNRFENEEELKAARNRPDVRNYQRNGVENRDTYRMKDVFLRIVRSLDYVKSRPEWNREVIISWGPSLGGAQAIVAAAFDPQVSLCIAGAPAMCDHLGANNQQVSGWPNIIRNTKNPDIRTAIEKTMPYFDMVNFAKRVKCEVIFGVGFIDTICPPTSVYAAYNSLGTDRKSMYDVPMGDHGGNFKGKGLHGAFGCGHIHPRPKELCNPDIKMK